MYHWYISGAFWDVIGIFSCFQKTIMGETRLLALAAIVTSRLGKKSSLVPMWCEYRWYRGFENW